MWIMRFCRAVTGAGRVRTRVFVVRSSGAWVALARLAWVTQPIPLASVQAAPLFFV